MVEQNKLLGLEVLRFLTACIVLFAHYHFLCDIGSLTSSSVTVYPFYTSWPFLYYLSNWPVRIFWCISGFIFFWKYQSPIANKSVSFKDFFVSRFARLYPLHFLTLIIVAVGQSIYFQMAGFHYLNDVRYTAPYFLSHLFMASNRVSNGDSFNWPVWSVCLELSVYLLFFVVTRYATRSILFNLLIVGLFAFVKWTMPGVAFMVLFECLFFFYIGGIAASLKMNSSQKGFLSRSMRTGVVLLPFLFWMKGWFLSPDKTLLFWSLWLPILLFCAAHDFKVHTWVRNIIETLGNMTYSSYLIHIPVQLFVAIICFRWKILLPLYHPLFLAGYVCFIFFLSYLTYRYFELPIKKKIKTSSRFAHRQSTFIFVGIAIHLILAFSPVVERWDEKDRANDSSLNKMAPVISGNIFMNTGRYLQAIAAYKQAIESYPLNPEVHVNLATIYFKLGRYSEALAQLEKAIAINPDYYAAYNIRGVVYHAQKFYDLALQDFNKALSLFPCEESHHNRSTDLNNTKKDVCENSAPIFFNIGSVYLLRKDYDAAMVHFNKAIARDSSYAKAYADRAVCYFYMKDLVRFRRDAQKAESMGMKVDLMPLRAADGVP